MSNRLENGASKDFSDDDGLTALHYAALGGFTDVVEDLVVAGFNINALSVDYGTALCLACLRNHTATVSLLLKHDAHVELVGRRVGTPLHCAGSAKVAHLLIDHGVGCCIDKHSTDIDHERFKENTTVLRSLEKGPITAGTARQNPFYNKYGMPAIDVGGL